MSNESKCPKDKDKKGYYIVKKSRRNMFDTADEIYYTDDVWTGEKWLLASILNSPVLDVIGYVGSDLSYNEARKKIKELNNNDKKEN